MGIKINEVFQEDIDAIITEFTQGSEKGRTLSELALFTDTFGPRMVGCEAHERSIDYLVNQAKDAGFNVTTEEVPISTFKRIKEVGFVSVPQRANKKIEVLALGYSPSTPPDGITAKAIVVSSFEELEARADQAKGKIVVVRPPWTSFEKFVGLRVQASMRAHAVGAVGALVRSMTPFSLYTIHAGSSRSICTPLPVAAITVEDADYIHRWAERGEDITIHLNIQTQLGTGVSRNVIVDYLGSEKPNEYVIISGHSDSWDIGEGAMDDASGIFVSWRAIHYLKLQGMQPKRTIRAVFWTGEETGFFGVKHFASHHKDELSRISLAMEADIGTFEPTGISFSGTNPQAQQVMQDVMKTLGKIGADGLRLAIDGSDIKVLHQQGNVPISSLDNKNDTYFYYHHTKADTVTMLNSDDMDKCSVVFATVAHIVANLDDLLPR